MDSLLNLLSLQGEDRGLYQMYAIPLYKREGPSAMLKFQMQTPHEPP